jgi:hypothetical protein
MLHSLVTKSVVCYEHAPMSSMTPVSPQILDMFK